MLISFKGAQFTAEYIRSEKENLHQMIDSKFNLVSQLLSCDVLTRNEKGRVENLATSEDRNNLLLEILIEKSADARQTFLKCLESTDQVHVVNYIVYGRGGKPVLNNRSKIVFKIPTNRRYIDLGPIAITDLNPTDLFCNMTTVKRTLQALLG